MKRVKLIWAPRMFQSRPSVPPTQQFFEQNIEAHIKHENVNDFIEKIIYANFLNVYQLFKYLTCYLNFAHFCEQQII